MSRARCSGILGFGIVPAPAVAPSLGGMLLRRFWSAIFWLGVPTGVAARGWPRAGCRCRARSRCSFH